MKGLNALDAFKKIVDTKLSFVSRGDDSGTHKKELTKKPRGTKYHKKLWN